MNAKNKLIYTAALGVAYLISPSAIADIVHNDDVIINGGSLCTGMDCVNGENFGFDTVRLKENNLRVHFDDTSNSASFPSNDWRIIINDTTNGGANHFSVEDTTGVKVPFRIEAGAKSDTLVVDSSSRVGIGTANPVVKVHTVDGNTPTLRLEQDGSSGFTAQTWDLASNEANFFIRDVTNSSALPFRIKPGSPSDSIHITPDSVGIGTSSPNTSAALDIKASGNNSRAILADKEIAIIRDGAGGLLRVKNETSGQTWRITMLGDDSLAIKDQTTGVSNGAQIILKPGGQIELRGDVDVTGNLTCNGGSC